MSKNNEYNSKASGIEKGSRLYRNFNALGAALIAAAAVIIPGPNVVLASWAGLNAVQAGAGEVVRRGAEKKRKQVKK